jgi:hypothetical protein
MHRPTARWSGSTHEMSCNMTPTREEVEQLKQRVRAAESKLLTFVASPCGQLLGCDPIACTSGYSPRSCDCSGFLEFERLHDLWLAASRAWFSDDDTWSSDDDT